MSWVKKPEPVGAVAETGSHPSAIANTTISTIPDTNSGTVSIDWPTMLIVRSIGLPAFSAATTPPMIPSGTTMTNAKIASFSERPSALVRIGPIGAWYWYDVPGKWLIQCQYWVRIGLSTPSWWSSAWTALGAASGPRIERPGSLGRTWPRKNTITLRSHSVISARPRRLRMNLTMFVRGP